MAFRLIINADDFGISKSVNQAIIDVFTCGNLSSATLMVNMGATENAVKLARQYPELAVGLHFCITEGKPLTDCTTLVDKNGNFINRAELLKGIFGATINYEEIRNEFNAQLDKFLSYGLTPTHSDSHQHVMMFPQVFRSILPILEEHNLPVRKVNPPKRVFNKAGKKPAKLMRQTMNKIFSRKMQALYLNKTNDYLISIHDLGDSAYISTDTYTEMLKDVPDNMIIELMVHPYVLDDEVTNLYMSRSDKKKSFLDKCEREYEILSGAPLFQNYELCSYKIFQ